MIRLHYSNRLEELVAPLCASMRASQRQDPLRAFVTVVPNRIYEDFLRLRLADACGVAANLEFPFLSRYLARAINDADPESRVLDTGELSQAVFECLRALPEHPALAPVQDYIARQSGESAEREQRTLKLSGRIARLFREYATSRQAMLRQWRRGADNDPTGLHPDVRWQRFVYRLLFDAEGCLRERWLDGAIVRWRLLPDALAAADPGRLAAALAKPLHIFGLAYAGPEFVRMFARLGELTEVHLYCINPCVEFWEDVPAGHLLAGTALVARGSKLAQDMDDVEDPFEIGGAGENQALMFWSMPGREYTRLINELTQCDFESHFALPAPGLTTLLARLQHAILLRQPAPDTRNSIAGGDSSIRILACPSVRREVEIIANAIWSLLHEDKTNPPLRFHQIGVLLPESVLPAYLPHLRAVLEEQYAIPLNLAEFESNAAVRAIEAAELLIRLPASRLSRDEVLRLLAHPALGGSDTEAEQWLRWCKAAGIFFGADERDLAGTYIPPENFNWDQGLRRLALGTFMESDGRIYPSPGGLGYLPLDVGQDHNAAAAGFIHRARRLIAEALDLRSRRATLGNWSEILCELLSAYILPATPAQARALHRCIAALRTMATPGLRSEPVSYLAACDAAVDVIADARAQAGGFAESGVAVGSMSALRSIPLRAIFVAGLGEAMFPARTPADPLDLRTHSRRAGDVSPAQRDRYLFLEASLAARERLVVSYVARDEMSGEALGPSPVINELLHMLGEDLSAALTIRHPVSRYDLDYFRDLGGRGVPESDNFDPMAHRGARIAILGRDLAGHCGAPPPIDPLTNLERFSPDLQKHLAGALRLIEPPAPLPAAAPESSDIVLPLSALKRLLECPLQAGARYRLGMLDDEEDDDGESEEPVNAPFLPLLGLLREAFWQGRGELESTRGFFERQLAHDRLAGQVPAGPFFEAVRSAGVARLERGVTELSTLDIGGLRRWQRIRIGDGSRDNSESDLKLPPLQLVIDTGNASCASIRATLTVSPGLDASYRFVAGERPGPRDFVDGYLAAFALAASGQQLPPRFKSIALGHDPDKFKNASTRRLSTPQPEQARRYLEILAQDLLGADHDYFLPFEAVEQIVKTKTDTQGRWSDEQITEAIEKVRENRRPCRSDYGPVRNARSFPAPEPRLVREIIERRFGPLKGIFEKE